MALFAEQVPGTQFGTVPGVGSTGRVPDRMVQFRPDPAGIFPVTAWLDQESPAATPGDAVVDREAVPRRTARTVWRGRDPITIQIDVVFEGYARGRSVETDLRNLDEMMGRGRRGTPREPVELIVDANGWVPYDVTRQPDLRWWIEGVEHKTGPDDVIRRGGNRLRQRSTVQLVQVVTADLALRATTADRARAQLQRDAKLTYTVREGDTLAVIAKRIYGRADRQTDIAVLNGLSTRSKLKVGRVLRLP